MDLNAYLAVLAAEATSLAAAADEAGLDAPVPTCPGWTVADLVLHVGEVHRWATAVVASRATKLGDVPSDSLGPLPEPGDTISWFRDGASKLCDALAGGDTAVDYAAFLTDPPAPRLLFWARPVHSVRARRCHRRHRRVPHRLSAPVAKSAARR
jgi:Mycothiol maleylpyruvate isomerase N-terminal domain